MRNRIIVAVAILAAIILGGILFARRGEAPVVPHADDSGGSSMKTFSSEKLAFSFSYPEKYFLTEEEVNVPQRYHARLMIIEDNEGNRALLDGSGPAGELPSAIMVDIYQNDLDKQTAEQWVKNTSDSNFKLGTGNLATTTIGGLAGVIYNWSGLYEADAVVLANEKYVYMFTGTYIAREDTIRGDFAALVSSARFE